MAHVLRLILVVTLIVVPVFSSYCGKTAVPYSFEVLPNGAPVLGCAQPSCVAAAEEPLIEDSEFLTDVAGQSDGFFRDGDRALKRYRHESAPKMVANCSGQFNELSCPRKNQYVGGIEYIDHPRQPLILQCCTYDGLRFSQEVGTTTIGPGEAITGGEVVRDKRGRQISFDVIANVRKIVRSSGTQRVSYEVTVRRMNCLADPSEPEVDVDDGVAAEVLRVLSSATAKEVGATDKPEKKVERKGGRKNRKQNAAPTEEISDNTNGHEPLLNSAGHNSQASMRPITRPQPVQQPIQQPNQQVPIVPQQQPYQQPYIPPQQPQQYIDPNQPQYGNVVPAAPVVETSTAFPTLPTLFPTHTFPTFPPHTFPTIAPHTLFPSFTATPAPAPFPAFGVQPSSGASAFAAPSVNIDSSSIPTFAPFTHTFPTFSPIPIFGTSTHAPIQTNFGQQQDASATQFVQQPQQQAAQSVPQYQQPISQPIDASTQQQIPQQYQQPAQSFQQPQQPAVASSPAPMTAMGTILQNFQNGYHPISVPGLGLIGYGSSKK